MRRYLLLILVTSLPIILPAEGQTATMKISNTLAGEGLTVVDSSSASFLPQVVSLLGPSNATVGKELLPYALLLTNKTTKSIWGFTVIYTFLDKLSGIGKPWTIEDTSACWGPTDAQFMLGPGDTYLVTPVSDLAARQYSNGQVLAPPPADEGLLRYIQNFKTEFLGGRVSVQIESVIFDDGRLIGADDAGVTGRVNSRVKAEKDLLTAIRPLHGEQLHDYLSASKTPELQDEYFMHRASRAQEFEHLLNAQGETDFKNQIALRRYGQWFNHNDFITRENK